MGGEDNPPRLASESNDARIRPYLVMIDVACTPTTNPRTVLHVTSFYASEATSTVTMQSLFCSRSYRR